VYYPTYFKLFVLAKNTNNPIADEEMPVILRHAIRNDVVVLVTDADRKLIHKLSLSKLGSFIFR